VGVGPTYIEAYDFVTFVEVAAQLPDKDRLVIKGVQESNQRGQDNYQLTIGL
jgi:hypothetical protein